MKNRIFCYEKNIETKKKRKMFLKRKDLIPFCEILFLNFVQNHVSYALSHIHLAAARRPASELVE